MAKNFKFVKDKGGKVRLTYTCDLDEAQVLARREELRKTITAYGHQLEHIKAAIEMAQQELDAMENDLK